MLQAGDLSTHVANVLSNVPVEVLLQNKKVEVRPHGITKGIILERILQELGFFPNISRPESNASFPVRSLLFVLVD